MYIALYITVILLVIDIAWTGMLCGLYSHEPKGQSPKGEWLYKPISMNLPCYMCYVSVTSSIAIARVNL